MIEAIGFDFDRVIADSERLHHRAFCEVLGPHGVSIDYRQYLSEYVGLSDADFFRTMLGSGNGSVAGTNIEALLAEKAAAFDRMIDEHTQTFPGSLELVESAAAVMPIAIASGALADEIERQLAHLGGPALRQRFATIVSADQVKRSKPDPETYLTAVQRLGVAAAQCLAIEDTPDGLRSALAAGLRTLAVAHTVDASALAHAERVVEGLEGVTVERLRQWYG